MSQIEQFGNLVQDARRDDDYINATKWCKHFGYRLNNWKQLPETKARLAALSKELKISHSVSKEIDYTDNTECLKISHSVSKEVDYTDNTECLKISHSVSKELIYTSGKGYRAVTWIHPVMAIHLASYLDPTFANYVAKTFIRYAKADPTLAADIASRQNTVEGLDIINKAVQKQYSLIFGRDWLCETSEVKFDFLDKTPRMRDKLSESNLVSVLNNKFGLPCKGLVAIHPLSEELLEDFLKDKYPNIYQSSSEIIELRSGQYLHIPLVDEVALFSYFILEINDWIKEKGGTDCSFLR